MKSIKKDYKEILIAILIMGIISMSIVYANFTRRLQIESTATVNSSNWDIHFENLVKTSSDSSANVISPATISEAKTVISGLDVELTKPGDYITYTFDVVNAGDLDAKLYSFVVSKPTCSNDEAICNSISYTIKYSDGSDIKLSDTLKVNERKNITMTIRLDSSITNMPKGKVNISNINAIFDYMQD